MKCRSATPELLDFIEDRLDAEAARGVESHLSVCATCREKVQELRATLAVLAEDPVPEMPLSEERFLQEVRRQIRRQPAHGFRPFRVLVPALAAAAALLLAVGVLSQLRRSSAPAPTRPDALAFDTADDPADPLAAVSTDDLAVSDSDMVGIEAVDEEVAQSSEIDDLVEDLTPPEQIELVKDLEAAYPGVRG